MKKTLIFFLALTAAVSAGCASRNIPNGTLQGFKQILDITINENSESVILTINGNQTLTHTLEEAHNPKGIILNFPETSAGNVAGRFIPPENEIINFIKVADFVEDEAPLAVIYVALNHDSIYDVISDNNDIQIYFTKKANVAYVLEPQKESVVQQPEPEPEPIHKHISSASELKAVTAEPLQNATRITIEADGTIENYKTFKMINPDRIVFDLYNLNSPYRKQQIIDLQSEWVQRIRYYGHPDKLRLVIDTRDNRLLKYTSEPTDTGLTILITPP